MNRRYTATPVLDSLSSSSRGAARSAPGLRVVVADDDRDEALTLSTLLTHDGHLVREVYRGDAVFDEVCLFKPDAVLLDIGMPGMTGYEVARELRRHFRRACPLLIAITGWNKGADRILGQIVGFDHYVTKPYDPLHVLALLKPSTPPTEAA
jgi:DNA-binding response OmpR family regulator